MQQQQVNAAGAVNSLYGRRETKGPLNSPPEIALFLQWLNQSNDGKVTWKKLCAINHRTLGGFLSAHLIIEHYLTEALKRTVQGKEKLNWDSARLTFSQKVNLFCVNDDFRARFVPCLKHLTS